MVNGPLGADAEGWGGDKLAVLALSSLGRPFLGVASREHEALGLPGRARGLQEGGSRALLQQVEGRSSGQGGSGHGGLKSAPGVKGIRSPVEQEPCEASQCLSRTRVPTAETY